MDYIKRKLLIFSAALMLTSVLGIIGCDGDSGGGDDDADDDIPPEWSVYTIESIGEPEPGISIALDSKDNAHIAYYKCGEVEEYLCTVADLKYATNASGDWKIFTIDSDQFVGQYPSIAVASDDSIHISYYNCGDIGAEGDCSIADLYYATNAGGDWQTFAVDHEDYVGRFTSIALDSSDSAHISYYDGTYGNIKYATNATGDWQSFTLGPGRYTGWDTSIAIDSNDNVHISYFDYPDYDLKYITNASGSWELYTLDSKDNAGWDTSIAIDSNDNVYISYHDWTNSDLKCATNSSGDWQLYAIDSSKSVGLHTSIATDPADKLHISYFYCGEWTDDGSCSDSDLRYATNKAGDWQTITIDYEGEAGYYTSIAVDSKGKVHISYWGNSELRYATNALGK